MAGKRRKHVPQRTCIACQEKRPKRELLRIVRTPQGTIEVDPKGKKPGRGAYLCPRPACWDLLDERKLSRALKCQVGADQTAELRAAAALLWPEAEGAPLR